MTRSAVRPALAAAALVLALVAPARAQLLPAELAASQPPLRESGAGEYRYFGFHVYDSRLWVTREKPEPDSMFVLGLRYSRDFRGNRIARQSDEEIRRLGLGSEGDRVRWLEEMTRLFPDVKQGDELAGQNLPGRGIRFFLNGKAIGEVADPAFARAFFAIWLDPRTRGADLRAALLGERSGERK